MSKIVSRYEIWRVHGYFAWLPKYSQFGTPQSTPKPPYIFICQVVKFPSSFSFLLKPSNHLLEVDAEAENLANNDLPTAAQFDVKLALDIEKIDKSSVDYHNIIDII